MERSEFWCKFHFYMVHPKFLSCKRRAVSRISVQSSTLLPKYFPTCQSEPAKGSVPEKGRNETIFHQLQGFLIPKTPVAVGRMYTFESPQRESHFKMFYIKKKKKIGLSLNLANCSCY